MGKVTAIIVAAGKGIRMGMQSVSKPFLRVGGVPILVVTLKKFGACSAVDTIILVARREDQVRCDHLIKEHTLKKVDKVVEGGAERQDSVFQGLLHVNQDTEIVLIHDAVRMFVTEEIITASIQDASIYGASVTAVPVTDTIKQVASRTSESTAQSSLHNVSKDEGNFVVKTLNRRELWQIQTPQTFQYQLILSVYQQARHLGMYGTDDAMLAEHFGHPVKIVYGSYRNIKITTPDDLLIAEAFYRDEMGIEQLKSYHE